MFGNTGGSVHVVGGEQGKMGNVEVLKSWIGDGRIVVWNVEQSGNDHLSHIRAFYGKARAGRCRVFKRFEVLERQVALCG